MKIITLLPVKNEDWILKTSLQNFSSFSDVIIIADQNSEDKTIEIANSFPKVKVINNPHTGHSNKVRWLLLDEARKIEGEKLIICLDADELISPDCVSEMIKYKDEAPVSFSSMWMQAWNGMTEYRTDGAWGNNYKQFAFFDDGKVDYIREEVINDHTNRIPEIKKFVTIKHPIIHLQLLAKRRSETKQVWYMCNELVKGLNPYKINLKYSISRYDAKVETNKIPNEFLNHITIEDMSIFDSEDNMRMNEILSLFKKYNVQYFESLDIWHIPELSKIFTETANRKPRPKILPKWIVLLNNIKNKIRYSL